MSDYAPGWYPDPTGRFAQRYYDGATWTDTVADAAGVQASDPVSVPPPEAAPSTAPSAPPPSAPPPSAPPPSVGAPSAPPAATARGSSTTLPFEATIANIAVLVGALLVFLSLVAFKWAKTAEGPDVKFSLGDLADLEDLGADLNFFLSIYASFLRWLAILLVIGVVLAVLRVVPPLNQLRDDPSKWQIIGFVVLGFAGWHLLAMIFTGTEDGVNVSFGAYLGLIGWGALSLPWTSRYVPESVPLNKKLGA